MLLTRPAISWGVSCCDIVCAGTMTKAIVNPSVNMLKAAVGMLRKRPSTAAPIPRPSKPLKTTCGLARPRPRRVTSWVPGGYSVQPHAWSSEPGPLEGPVGRIAFAGEHTARDWVATMEGALRSGERAARDALEIAGSP